MAYLLDEAEGIRWENNKAVKTLQKDCDPGPLLELGKQCVTDKRLQEACPLLYTQVLFNYEEATLAVGFGEPVLGLREGIHEDDSTVGAGFWTFYWLYKSIGHVLSERWEEATLTHGKAMGFFKRCETTEEAGLRQRLCANGYAIQLHYGQTEGMEERIQVLLKLAPNPWRTVEYSVLLGKYYFAVGRAAEARQPLEYAAVHGNRLFARFEAEELLRELEGKGPSDRKRAMDAKRKVESIKASPCDPTPTLEACEEALADEGVLREKELCSLIRLHMCVALVNLGRYDEARVQLEQVRLGESLTKEPVMKIQMLHLRVVLDTAQGRLTEAAEEQNEAMKLFREHSEPELVRSSLCGSGCSLQIKLGQLDGVEERAKWLLESAKDEFARVVACMLLGRYYVAMGQADSARPHLEYAAAHGNKLHQQREAEALLKGL